jgi:hypothetical protein
MGYASMGNGTVNRSIFVMPSKLLYIFSGSYIKNSKKKNKLEES